MYTRCGWRKLAGAEVMAFIVSGDSPEAFLVDFFRDCDGATLLGNPAETAQKPGLAHPSLAGYANDKPPAFVVNAVQEIAPKEIQLIPPSDKLVLTPLF